MFASQEHNAALEASSQAAPSRVRKRRAVSPTGPGAEGATSDNGLLNFEVLPEYLRDNEFIQTGYRATRPVKETLRSLFNLHNETGNVWSHLLGFLFFLGLTIWVSRSPPAPLVLAQPHVEQLWNSVKANLHQAVGSVEGNLQQLQERLPRLPLPSIQQTVYQLQDKVHLMRGSWQHGVHSLHESVHSLQALAGQFHERLSAAGDVVRAAAHHQHADLLGMLAGGLQWPTPRWPMYVFCAGAMSCLLLSAFCHLLGCCQKHIAQFIWRLDYTGIALLIVSSFYPMVYYCFQCEPLPLYLYLVTITVLGAIVVAMSLLERFQQREWRHIRAGSYVFLGLMGVVPLVHQMLVSSHVWHVRTAVVLDVVMGVCYLLGAAIYTLRVPERWFPGKFDLIMHSHQIFHVCVVLGAYIHWRAVMLMLEWRDASGGCALPILTPLHNVMEDLNANGHSLYRIEQVWDWLRHEVGEHLHLMAQGQAGTQPVV